MEVYPLVNGISWGYSGDIMGYKSWGYKKWDILQYIPVLVNQQFAIENGHRNSGFTWIYPLKIVIFHGYVAVYQRVSHGHP